MAKKADKSDHQIKPSGSVHARGGQKGTTHTSKCASCGQDIEKDHDANGKVTKDWHHV